MGLIRSDYLCSVNPEEDFRLPSLKPKLSGLVYLKNCAHKFLVW